MMTPRTASHRPITRPFHHPPVGLEADRAKVRASLRAWRHQLRPRCLEVLGMLWSDLAGLDGDRLDAAIRERLALRENAHYLIARFDPHDHVGDPSADRPGPPALRPLHQPPIGIEGGPAR